MAHQPTDMEAMHHAVALASRGPENGPNPQVGCVLLDAAGTFVAEGWHNGAGTPHAEVAALADAERRGADIAGGTAIVTVEPCQHTGRVGPCAQALIDANIARVVYAVDDPNVAARGGAEHLRSVGVEVAAGVGAPIVEKQLRVWLTAMRRGWPFVTAKLAMTLDGKVAAADGTSTWITGPKARTHAHVVRSEVGAVAVGTGTVHADNPSLTARDGDDQPLEQQPLRVVVGERDLPSDSTLAAEDVLHLRTHDPRTVLAELWEREVRHLLIDGGPTLLTAFMRAGLVDEFHFYSAPVLLGTGIPATGDLGITTLSEAMRLRSKRVMQLGDDVLLIATPATEENEPQKAKESHVYWDH